MIGAMKAIGEAGLKIPGDVSVMGFGDVEMCVHMHPGLSSVAFDKKAMTRQALAWILEPQTKRTGRSVRLPMKIVERASTGPAPA